MAKPKSVHIDVSYGTFLKLAILAIAAGFLFLVRELLLLIFIAIVIASALDPLVDWLHRRKIPRALTVLFVYIVLIGILVVIVSVLAPAVAEQIQELLTLAPEYLDKLAIWLGGLLSVSPQDLVNGDIVGSLTGTVSDSLAGVTDALSSTIRGFFSFLIVLVLAFYFSVQEDSFKGFIRSIVPSRHRLYVSDLTGRMQKQMGLWLRGQLILALVIFVLTFLVLSALHVPNALVLAMLAGLFEVVPYIGPILSAVPATLIAFTVSPLTAALVVVAYVIIQQLENHVLQPRIMGKVLGLNPLIVILAILIGAQLAGVLGAILAVPLVTAATVFLGDLFHETERLEDRLKSRGAREVRFFKPSEDGRGMFSSFGRDGSKKGKPSEKEGDET